MQKAFKKLALLLLLLNSCTYVSHCFNIIDTLVEKPNTLCVVLCYCLSLLALLDMFATTKIVTTISMTAVARHGINYLCSCFNEGNHLSHLC